MKRSILLLFLIIIAGCSKSELDKQWVAGWQETSSLSIARAGAAAVATNGYIYMIGGVDGRNFLQTTEFAKINADGSLGQWIAGSKLNEPRGFIDAIVREDYIYVVGGGNGDYGHNLLRSVERAKINNDGTLGLWERMTDMAVPRRCSKAIATDKRIFSFGGFGGALLDTVEYATFTDGEKLSEWTLESDTMTIPRYVNGVKKIGNSVYVIGGHDQAKGVGIQDVELSQFDQDGLLKNWKPTSSMQEGRYGLSTASHGNQLFVLGGISGVEYLDSIEVTNVSKDGGLGKWKYATKLTYPRSNFNAVVYADNIYILGGSNRDGYHNSVEYAQINSSGEIGFFASLEQRQEHEQRLSRIKTKVGEQLPNVGVVKETLDTQMYVYVLVDVDGQQQWLAGPKQVLRQGEKIRYSKGVYMTNFYSKELKRSFEAVLFVGKIEKQ